MESVRWILYFCIATALVNEGASQCSSSSLALNSTTTPEYMETNNPYANYETCEWSLSASAGSQIFVYIDFIYLEWNYDFLTIYDGSSSTSPQLYYSRYTRTSQSVLLSSGTDLYIRFTSDYSITYSGFRLKAIAVDRSSLPTCGSTLSATSTPAQISYVESVEQASSCSYIITATNPTDLIRYKVPLSSQYTFYIFDGSFKYQSAGTSSYVSAGQSITIYSDYPYVMNYEEVSNSATAVTASTTTSAPQVNFCSTTGTLTSTSTDQYILSPNYPASYPNNQYCAVTITASNTAESVFLYVEDYEMDNTDYLYVHDGVNSQFNLAGSVLSTGSSVNSTGASLHLIFVSDYSGTLRGLKLRYTSIARVAPSCVPSSYTTKNASLTRDQITSSNYPASYANDLREYWLIQKPTESDNLVLDITDMNIEDAIACIYDSITIYNGPCETDPVLAVLCGTQPVTFEQNTGLYVLVKFSTDSSVTSTGFNMDFYIGDYQDADDDDDGLELKDWIIPVIVLVVIIIILIIICIIIWFKTMRRKRQAKIHSLESGGPARTKLARKLTTHQLLTQFKNQLIEDEKKKQKKKKQQSIPPPIQHLPPNPPGPNATIINRGGMMPHPPPQPYPQQPQSQPIPQPQPPPQPSFDPVYPPGLFTWDSSSKPIEPVMPEGHGSLVPPPNFNPPTTNLNTVPTMFQYISPAETRVAGQLQPQA